jgi:hypothetical protein
MDEFLDFPDTWMQFDMEEKPIGEATPPANFPPAFPDIVTISPRDRSEIKIGRRLFKVCELLRPQCLLSHDQCVQVADYCARYEWHHQVWRNEYRGFFIRYGLQAMTELDNMNLSQLAVIFQMQLIGILNLGCCWHPIREKWTSTAKARFASFYETHAFRYIYEPYNTGGTPACFSSRVAGWKMLNEIAKNKDM